MGCTESWIPRPRSPSAMARCPARKSPSSEARAAWGSQGAPDAVALKASDGIFLKIWNSGWVLFLISWKFISLSLSIVAKIGMPAILIYRCMSIRDFVSNICQYSGNRQVRVVWRSLYSMYAAYKLVSNRKKINTRLRIRIVQRIHPRLGINTWYMLVFIDIQASVEVE